MPLHQAHPVADMGSHSRLAAGEWAAEASAIEVLLRRAAELGDEAEESSEAGGGRILAVASCRYIGCGFG
jgi:hypothetical protein